MYLGVQIQKYFSENILIMFWSAKMAFLKPKAHYKSKNLCQRINLNICVHLVLKIIRPMGKKLAQSDLRFNFYGVFHRFWALFQKMTEKRQKNLHKRWTVTPIELIFSLLVLELWGPDVCVKIWCIPVKLFTAISRNNFSKPIFENSLWSNTQHKLMQHLLCYINAIIVIVPHDPNASCGPVFNP